MGSKFRKLRGYLSTGATSKQALDGVVEGQRKSEDTRCNLLAPRGRFTHHEGADQKCFEIFATEDEGMDMELEFTTDDGKGTGGDSTGN